MADYVGILQMLVFGLCALCLPLLLIAGVGALIVKGVFKGNQNISQALAQDTPSYMAQSQMHLSPFSPAAFTDITSQLKLDGRMIPGDIHYRGQLQSHSQPGISYAVFDLHLKISGGAMLLYTTDHRLRLGFGGIGVRQVQVAFDEQPLGLLAPEGEEVRLVDTLQRIVGVYHRQPIKLLGMSMEDSDLDFRAYYGPVEVNGRVIGELNRNPLKLIDRSGLHTVHPLFRNVVPDLTRDDETWLLLLAAWEVYVQILTR